MIAVMVCEGSTWWLIGFDEYTIVYWFIWLCFNVRPLNKNFAVLRIRSSSIVTWLSSAPEAEMPALSELELFSSHSYVLSRLARVLRTRYFEIAAASPQAIRVISCTTAGALDPNLDTDSSTAL